MSYSSEREKYLNAYPYCGAWALGVSVYNCTLKATEIHHKSGRIGDLLDDPKYFIGLCHNCHCYFELHPELAYENGISIKRLNNK